MESYVQLDKKRSEKMIMLIQAGDVYNNYLMPLLVYVILETKRKQEKCFDPKFVESDSGIK